MQHSFGFMERGLSVETVLLETLPDIIQGVHFLDYILTTYITPTFIQIS